MRDVHWNLVAKFRQLKAHKQARELRYTSILASRTTDQGTGARMTYALGRGSSKNEHNEQVMPLILSTCTQSAGTLKFPFLNPLLHEQCEMRWISYINYNRIIFLFYI